MSQQLKSDIFQIVAQENLNLDTIESVDPGTAARSLTLLAVSGARWSSVGRGGRVWPRWSCVGRGGRVWGAVVVCGAQWSCVGRGSRVW